MSQIIAEDMEHFRALGKSAFVMGYSGMTGKALALELSKAKIFKKVVLIGRREIPLDVGPECEQKVVDFDKIEDHKDVFENLDVGFCCLGVPSGGGISREDYVRITLDYCVSSARIAKEQGCTHFNLVTGVGVSKNSWILYRRVKADLEEKIKEVNFDRLSIFRPGALLGDRQQRRITEVLFQAMVKPIIVLSPTAISITVDTFAKAMINNAVRPPNPPTLEVYEHIAIHQLAKYS